VATHETSGGRSGSVLAGLLAPLRLPERVLQALDELRPMRFELTRVREQTEPLPDLLPALEHLEEVLGTRLDAVHDVVVALRAKSRISTARRKSWAPRWAPSPTSLRRHLATMERVIHDLAGEVGAVHETIVGVKDDIQRTTGLRGDRGMMERARDVITGGHREEDRPVSEGSESESREETPT